MLFHQNWDGKLRLGFSFTFFQQLPVGGPSYAQPQKMQDKNEVQRWWKETSKALGQFLREWEPQVILISVFSGADDNTERKQMDSDY